MKKTLAAALTAAFVVGTSATTFAAANPFSDVPAGHWAYDSVAKLAAAGVVEGYGDGTYRGDRNITRYEMAQMIAKAMAKNTSGVNKAELDRLAAEFREELEALGVRVAELEKYADKVIWNGELRYRYIKDRENLISGGKERRSNNPLQFRLLPTAEVNDHWKIKARLTATANMKTNTSSDFKLTFAYADGDYGKFNVKVGKMPFYSNVDDGLLFDDFFSGAQITYGDKFKVLLSAGRWNEGEYFGGNPKLYGNDPASYQGGEISYDNDKLYIGAGYHHFRSDGLGVLHADDSDSYKDTKSADIWTVGGRYNFGDFGVAGAYAQNTKAKEFKRSWNAGLSYKGADRKNPGTWGISAAYRYVGALTSFAPTYDTYTLSSNKKGFDIGVDWAPLMNTQVYFNYFKGKTLDTKKNTETIFTRVSWFF